MGLLASGVAAFGLLAPPAPEMEWRAPPECPTRADVATAIEQYVGRPVDADVRRIAVTIERRPDDAFELRLSFQGAGGVALEETLRDASCEVVADAAALKIAFAIDPEATARSLDAAASQPEPAPTPEPEPAPTPEPEPEPEPRPEPAPAPARALPPKAEPEPRSRCAPGPSQLRTRGEGRLVPRCAAMGLRVGLQIGPLPRVGPGLGGHAAILWRRVRVEIGAVHWFAQSVRVSGSDRGGRLRMTAGDVAACARWGARTLEFPVCLGTEIGSFFGEGTGVDDPQRDRLAWVAALAHGRLVWAPIPRLATYAQAGVAVPLSAYRFFVNGDERVHASAPAAFRAALGVELRLP